MQIRSVLVVGAGSVGQVFGRHLARGGADVTFLVRPKYREAASRGFELYPLRRLQRRPVPVRFSGFDVVSELSELAGRRFDQVYLALASPSVRGSWLAALIKSIGDATLVSLQPSREDLTVIQAAGASPASLVAGGIFFISYAAPLVGETRFVAAGTAYWLPPLARSPFSGPATRVADVVAALNHGGLPATSCADVHRSMEFPNAIGMTYLTALKAAGWSVRALSDGPLLALGSQAVREVIAVVARTEGRPPPVAVRLSTSPSLLRATFWLGRRVTPFPLEPYLRQHFTKVDAQTRSIVASLVAKGVAAAMPVDALRELVSVAGESEAGPR